LAPLRRRSTITEPVAACFICAGVSSGAERAACVVARIRPLRSSTCAYASPLRSSRWVGVPAVSRRGAATAAASPARAARPSSIVESRLEATSTLSAIPAAASSTAITPVNTSVSFSRRGILRIRYLS
jgi:hypothetical protein